MTQEEYELYFFDDRQPFINRAVEQLYAPGSTFKVVTLAAALEGGGYEITDRISIARRSGWKWATNRCATGRTTNQGRITLSQALGRIVQYGVLRGWVCTWDRVDTEPVALSSVKGLASEKRSGIIGLNEESGRDSGAMRGRQRRYSMKPGSPATH